MNREAVYEKWRGKDHPWVAWVKAPLFERVRDDSHSVVEGPVYRTLGPPWDGVDTSWLPERAAVVIDLPGESAVFMALALGQRGLRPVFAVNACSESGELIPMESIIDALSVGARFDGAFPSGPKVAPAIVLDSRRDGAGCPVVPGGFDNRWAVFGGDLPSAEHLRSAGVTRVVLVQQGADPLGDVEAVLRTYQAGGLGLLLRDTRGSGPVVPLRLVERGWLAGVVGSMWRDLSLPRRWDGSYGRRLPIPRDYPSHG
jgi:hypothetical protein